MRRSGEGCRSAAGEEASGGWLWEEAARFEGFGDAADGERIGAEAEVGAVLERGGGDFGEGAAHDGFQAGVDLALGPGEAFLVLHPFEIADDDAAGVGEDVGDDVNALAVED